MCACSLLMVALSVVLNGAAAPTAAPPADFKLDIALYGARKEPIQRAELICRKGKMFHVDARSAEVVVYDPGTGLVELLDLKRKRSTEMTLRRLDEAQGRLRKALASAIAKREKQGGRGDRLAAEMSRNLLDPRLKEAFDAHRNRLRLTNPSVEIDAVGEAETDPVRLQIVSNSLAALVKLESFRDPAGIPPFPRLDALNALTVDHRLRPSEMTFLYRLAGPPKVYRWTYRFISSLTEDEVATLAKLDSLLERSRRLRFERYERGDPE